ncbi:MAG: helix-turn-helix domain-containing protein [Ileibacterium sp.]|nr:helix-turn-helix domain-containing protein [Ileibacterium sp.]
MDNNAKKQNHTNQVQTMEAKKNWASKKIILENMAVSILKEPKPEWDEETIKRNTVYASGSVLADPYAGIVYKKSRRQPYGPVERELLQTLILNRTVFCPRGSLIKVINDVHDHRINDNTLNKHINNIRRSLEDDGRTYIATQYSYGYKWDMPVYKFYLDRDD